MKRVIWICIALVFSTGLIYAQHPVMNPNDEIVNYDADNPIEKPVWGNMVKWVRTPRLGWDTDSFKAYFYKGMSFRIKWPANYDPSGETKYPMIIMLHGRGESGSIYDNEFQMKHGGKKHRDASNNGTWPGFIVFPQNTSGFFGESHYNIINDLINNHFPLLHVDANRISFHGLSAGGQSAWKYPIQYPKDVASVIPMSAASWSYGDGKDSLQHIPIWVSQGAKDSAPTPGSSYDLTEFLWGFGTNVRYTLYHKLGHGVWNTHYNESDFFGYMRRAHKANPVVTTGESALVFSDSKKDVFEFIPFVEICPNEEILVEMGLTLGFEGYEWRKDGVVIGGANSNTYVATELGTYDARILRAGTWSEWSPIPIVLTEKEGTQTPDIEIVGLASKVLPAPDGSTNVELELPNGYVKYEWFEEGNTNVISTDRIVNISQPGTYVARVTEQFGCSSNLSAAFKVVSATGFEAPDAAIGLSGYALSKTKVRLNWSDNPSPANDETAFEIYRSLSQDGDLELVGVNDANVLSFEDSLLNPNTEYFYSVRAVNESGSAELSARGMIKTLVDDVPPTAPLNLRLVSKTPTTVTLAWDESTDDVGVHKYDVFRGDNKSAVTGETSATVFNLIDGEPYRFTVKARDINGNSSPASNQIVVAPGFTGLNYKYFEGSWSVLPDFNALTPVEEGVTSNVDIGLAKQGNYIGFLWEGYINIEVPGTYTFETRSDDGSKLYIGSYDESNLVVNNDGLHGMQSRTGNYTFSDPGSYPIVITFFERGGGQGMEVYWQSNNAGISRERIPDVAFSDGRSIPDVKPVAPTNLMAEAAGFDRVSLSWVDQSDDEVGFQIYRSTAIEGPFYPVVITEANSTSFTDTGLDPETLYFYQLTALGELGQSNRIGTNFEMLGAINNGIAAKDNGVGTGFIMFSEESVHSRFSPAPHGSNSDHLIAIVNDNGTWKYDNNQNLYNFTPRDGDIILAEVDFSNDLITGLEGTDNEINGIVSGYQSGDLQFFANRWNGSSNNGEFTITGTQFFKNTGEIAQVQTGALPGVPLSPQDLSATSSSPGSINLEWLDNSNNEDGFDIYRSASNNQNFLYLNTLPAESFVYQDSGLFSNATYYYKVVAFNAGGTSESNETSARTLNNDPVLDEVGNLVIKVNTSLEVQLYAEDVDPETMTFSATNLPAFASLNDYGDGTGLLSFFPIHSDSGLYENIIIQVEDQNGGKDSDTLSVLVDDNSLPSLVAIDDITLQEGDSSSFIVTASDSDGTDLLEWKHNLPDFVSFTSALDGSATLSIVPGYTHSGSYSIFLEISDPDGGIAREEFLIQVIEQDPNEKYLINFSHSLTPGSPWNNVTSLNPINLIDAYGQVSDLGLEFTTQSWKTFNNGASTGNDSGVFPDNVIKDYYYFGIFGAPDEVSFKATGLDTNKDYSFTFFGSSSWSNVPDNGSTIYTIGDTSATLYVQDNSLNTVTISDVSPDENGDVLISMSKAEGTPVGYINAMTISYTFDDGSIPAAPRNLTAQYVPSQIELSWIDAPFNELAYEVYRSVDDSTFVLLATLDANTTAFVDADLTDGSTYTYKVRASNSIGESEFVSTGPINLPNVAPIISFTDQDIELHPGETLSLAVSATDPPSNQITLSIHDAPSFVSFTDNGSGNGTLEISPTTDDIGSYSNINIVAVDDQGAFSNRPFSIVVNEEILYTVSINFTKNSVEGSPWNNTAKDPSVNDFFGNLIDSNGTNTGIGLRLNTPFGGSFNQGATTGNNSGIVPDNVLREYYWFGIFSAPETAQIQLEGLNNTGRYNLKFVGSSVFSGSGISDNGETIYEVGNKQVALDVQGNTQSFGVIRDIVPSSSGTIVIDISKGISASVGYINGLVLEALPATEIDQTPSNLLAEGLSQSEIRVTWQDNSFEETGYEILRSENGESGPFELISTTNADVSSFEDGNLSGGTEYTYKVRAIFSDASFTDYSNLSSAATMVFSVKVNINGDPTYNAVSPWNNIGFLPDDGMLVPSLKDQNNNNTGIGLNFVSSLGGENDWGFSTGNESGVYPDDVLRSFFFMEALETAEVHIEGLDQSYIYNFRFLGSIETGFNVSTQFTIGDETVVNWQTDNTSGISSIIGVEPDVDNKVVLNITSGTGSRWSIWNALVIEAYPNLNSNARFVEERPLMNDMEVTVFPNPFIETININMPIEKSGEVNLLLHDIQGRLLRESVLTVHEGNLQPLRFTIEGLSLNKGLYLLRIHYGDKSHTFNVLKE